MEFELAEFVMSVRLDRPPDGTGMFGFKEFNVAEFESFRDDGPPLREI